ncbi:MAG: hypothetical protein J6X88_01190 [Bacteroidales bacterium]|nr:hypothetical protein [Bacteroidales bacterium]
MEEIINKLKELLLGKVVAEEEFKRFLSSQGYDNSDIKAIISEMLRTPGFSFMNGTVTYRGADYVAKMPPNQPH